MSSLVTSYFHFHATACFILVHVHYLWYAYFFIVHYAWLTLRGHWTLGFYYIIVAMSLLQTVNFMFPFNSCISPDFYCVITWPLGMLPLSKILLLWHDSIWILSISWLDWSIVKYHHLVMLSLYTQHDTLDLWLLSLRELDLLSCTMISSLFFLLYTQWPDHIVLVLLIPDHAHFLLFPVKW